MRRRNGARSPLLAALKHSIERAAGNAGVGSFRIADGAGFVDFLAGQPDIGGGKTVLIWNGFRPTALLRLIWPRRVNLVSQPALREAFDFKRIGLGAIAT